MTTEMVLSEIEADIQEIENNAKLHEESSFAIRQEAIDFIEFHVIDRIDILLQNDNHSEQLILLKKRARKIKGRLEIIDFNLFQQIREGIRFGLYNGGRFRGLIEEYFGSNFINRIQQEATDYDSLDAFTNGLFSILAVPAETKTMEPDMVYYQKTPARIIFELIEKANLQKDDVFYDLGSGLGQVTILVNLLGGIKAFGIEFEPAYCNAALASATNLNLLDVEFIVGDARFADYSHGTLFFMFTPFKGEMLEEVLEVLRRESTKRTIKIFTYGPCTNTVAQKNWLTSEDQNCDQVYKLHAFKSVSV
jgi:hypothetical protein